MKRFLALILVLMLASNARSASPSFNSFLPQQFTNNGISIGLNTNYVLTWQMVTTSDLTTNGNALGVNTNKFPTLTTIQSIVQNATNPFIA